MFAGGLERAIPIRATPGTKLWRPGLHYAMQTDDADFSTSMRTVRGEARRENQRCGH